MAISRPALGRCRWRSALTAAVLLAACGGGGSTRPPAVPGIEAPPPGAITVTDVDRLAWRQDNDASNLQFVAYVDNQRVPLSNVTCSADGPSAECLSPLPSLAAGVHTLAVAAVSLAAGAEGEPSESITVWRASSRSVVSVASLPDATATSQPESAAVVTTVNGQQFVVDVAARDLVAPVQLASLPEGRVIVADGTGTVRFVGAASHAQADARDVRSLFDEPVLGGVGLASHPRFAENHFVYVAAVTGRTAEASRLRVLRTREVADALGEAATVFETPLATSPNTSLTEDTPRLAFGPDGLLYVLSPDGTEFDHEPAASRPNASMLCIDENGRVPELSRLSDIASRPLGFSWHPSTKALWGILPADAGLAVVRALEGSQESSFSLRRMSDGRASAGTLRVSGGARIEPLPLDYTAASAVRLSIPIATDGLVPGLSGLITDVAIGSGAIYLAARDDDRAGKEVLVRLWPRTR